MSNKQLEDKLSLAEKYRIEKEAVNKKHMEAGVTIIDPAVTYIDSDVEIEPGAVIYPCTFLRGKTKISKGCVIGPSTTVENSAIGENTKVINSVVTDSTIGSDTNVGPFAYIRPNCNIGSNIKIGDFVEVKNSTIGDGTKVSHLTYIGDSDVGKEINFGCGTVTVNYDGKSKHRTVIEDNAFIGCNANLVAPVTIKENAFIAAGSTITDDVSENSLAIARARQVVKENWRKK